MVTTETKRDGKMIKSMDQWKRQGERVSLQFKSRRGCML